MDHGRRNVGDLPDAGHGLPGPVWLDDSPDCGHRYARTSAGKPNNAYPISAMSYWVVDWTGPGGSSGRITLDLISRRNIVVGKLQALVTN